MWDWAWARDKPNMITGPSEQSGQSSNSCNRRWCKVPREHSFSHSINVHWAPGVSLSISQSKPVKPKSVVSQPPLHPAPPRSEHFRDFPLHWEWNPKPLQSPRELLPSSLVSYPLTLAQWAANHKSLLSVPQTLKHDPFAVPAVWSSPPTDTCIAHSLTLFGCLRQCHLIRDALPSYPFWNRSPTPSLSTACRYRTRHAPYSTY